MALLAAAACAVAAASARAAGPPVAVLEFRTEGEIAPAVRDHLDQGLHAGLARSLSVTPLPAVEAAMDRTNPGLRDCRELACLQELVRLTGSRVLVRATARSEMEFYHLSVSAEDGRTGRVLLARSADCEICTLIEATQALRTTAERFSSELAPLVGALPAAGQSTQTLELSSTPEGATVFIDGEPAGRTPTRADVREGRHIVEMRLAGYGIGRAAVQVQAGAAPLPIRLTLAPAPPPPQFEDAPDAPPAPPPGVGPGPVAGAPALGATAPPTRPETPAPRRPAGGFPYGAAAFASLGSGLALLGTGGALIAKDGHSTCDGVPMQQCPTVYDTGRAGLVAVILGGGALLTSVVLFLLDQAAAGHGPETPPQLPTGR